MGAAESTPLAPGGAPSSAASASPSLQAARPLHQLQHLSTPPPTDPESHFYTALFHDIAQLPAPTSRAALIAALVAQAVLNPTSPHASALSSTMRAAVHHLRLPPSPPQLGALQLANAAIATLRQVAADHTEASLPLAAGPAETTLPPPDRVDLADSLCAHLMLAALDLLAHPRPSPLVQALSAATVTLLNTLLQPRAQRKPRHDPVSPRSTDSGSTTDNNNDSNRSESSTADDKSNDDNSENNQRNSPTTNNNSNLLASLASYPQAPAVLVALLKCVETAAPHAHTEQLLLLSAPPSTPRPPDKGADGTPWDAFDLFSVSSSSIALRNGLSDVVSALSSATSRLTIRRAPAPAEPHNGADIYAAQPRSAPASLPPLRPNPASLSAHLSLPALSTPSSARAASTSDLFKTGEQALCVLAQLCTQPGSAFHLGLRDLRDGIACPFSRLHDALARWLAHPLGALLGHLLLVGNRSFRTFALARTDPEALLLPLLAGLRRRCAPGALPADAYIPATTLLALTSDRGFCEAIDAVPVPDQWLPLVEERARLGSDRLVVSGAVLLVCARAVHQSLVMRRQRPEDFLCRVCLGVMGNVAGDATNVHPLVAERLVSLVEFLGRRRKRALLVVGKGEAEAGYGAPEEKSATSTANGDARQPDEVNKAVEKNERAECSNDSGSFADHVVANVSEFVAMGLEIIVGVLRARSTVAVNRHLVYTLMHREGVLDSTHVGGSSVKAEALVHMLRRVLHFFSRFVEEVEVRGGSGGGGSGGASGLRTLHHAPGISVERVFEVIEDNARMLHGDVFDGVPMMGFAYREMEGTDKFLRWYAVSLAGRRTAAVDELRLSGGEKLMDLPAGFGVYQVAR